MTATANQIARTAKEWNSISGEKLDVQQIGCAIYGFGSELATLRLLKKYRNSPNADCGFSTNLNAFYFMVELGA